MAEKLVGAFPSLVIQGLVLGRFYWLLVSDRRSIFVPLRPRAFVDSLDAARLFVGRVRGIPSGSPFDLAQQAAAIKGARELAHADIQHLSVRRLVNSYRFKYLYRDPRDPFAKRSGFLMPPREYLKGTWAGTAAIRALHDYALAFRNLYLSALPAALAQNTEWKV